MLLNLQFFNLAPQRSILEFFADDRRVLDEINAISTSLQRHLGVFKVDGWNGAWAELTVTSAATLPAARLLAGAAPDPAPLAAALARRERSMAERRSIVLEALIPSPNVAVPLRFDQSLVRIVLSDLAPGKTLPAFAAVNGRVTDRYSEHMAQIGWYYAGLYRVHGAPPFVCSEVDIVRANSPDEANARDKAHAEPEDIRAIYAECRPFFGPTRRVVWLSPAALSAVASEPLRLRVSA